MIGKFISFMHILANAGLSAICYNKNTRPSLFPVTAKPQVTLEITVFIDSIWLVLVFEGFEFCIDVTNPIIKVNLYQSWIDQQ